jgi:hypothetical protein
MIILITLNTNGELVGLIKKKKSCPLKILVIVQKENQMITNKCAEYSDDKKVILV